MEYFKLIEDVYIEMNKKYKETFGYDLSSKKELIESYKHNTNIERRDINGELLGFLNYVDNGVCFDFKTLAIKKELRGTYKGAKIAVGLFNEMVNRANYKGIIYINLVLLTLENTIKNMAEKLGFKITGVPMENRVLLRKDCI